MLKKTVKSINFNNEEQEETLYFNLTEPEIVEFDVEIPGGLEAFIENIDVEERPEEIMELFVKVIRKSYGEKSEDGKHFIKTDEATELFMASSSYSALFVELLSDADVAAEFFSAVLSSTAVNQSST